METSASLPGYHADKSCHRWLVFSFFLLAAVCVRFFRLEEQSLWNDEMFSMDVAASAITAIQPKLAAYYHHPPLFFYLAHFALQVFGHTAWALRCVAALSGSLTVGFVYLFASKLFGSRAGVASGFFSLVATFHLAYSQEGRPYALAALLCLLNLFFFVLILQEQKKRWIVSYGLSSLALLYTHHWGIFILASQIFFGVFLSGYPASLKKTFASAWGVIVLVYLPEALILRQQALGRPSEFRRGEGLALLMRSGMRAWMQAWAQCMVELPAPPNKQPSDDAMFPFAIHREVTMILAAMVLHGGQEASA